MTTTDHRAAAAAAAGELGAAVGAIDPAAMEALAREIAGARRVVLHGLGREGLMMRALAMRLAHLGLDAHVLGDATAPPVGDGDLLVVSAGPGWFATVGALADMARRAGARVACVTAQPAGRLAREADLVLAIPAQTMADDRGGGSILPMGSLFEAAELLAFELLVLRLREMLGETAETMRARHTNLE